VHHPGPPSRPIIRVDAPARCRCDAVPITAPALVLPPSRPDLQLGSTLTAGNLNTVSDWRKAAYVVGALGVALVGYRSYGSVAGELRGATPPFVNHRVLLHIHNFFGWGGGLSLRVARVFAAHRTLLLAWLAAPACCGACSKARCCPHPAPRPARSLQRQPPPGQGPG
jgi:hypothetical protein